MCSILQCQSKIETLVVCFCKPSDYQSKSSQCKMNRNYSMTRLCFHHCIEHCPCNDFLQCSLLFQCSIFVSFCCLRQRKASSLHACTVRSISPSNSALSVLEILKCKMFCFCLVFSYDQLLNKLPKSQMFAMFISCLFCVLS
jgi:hypothetical protein